MPPMVSTGRRLVLLEGKPSSFSAHPLVRKQHQTTWWGAGYICYIFVSSYWWLSIYSYIEDVVILREQTNFILMFSTNQPTNHPINQPRVASLLGADVTVGFQCSRNAQELGLGSFQKFVPGTPFLIEAGRPPQWYFALYDYCLITMWIYVNSCESIW